MHSLSEQTQVQPPVLVVPSCRIADGVGTVDLSGAQTCRPWLLSEWGLLPGSFAAGASRGKATKSPMVSFKNSMSKNSPISFDPFHDWASFSAMFSKKIQTLGRLVFFWILVDTSLAHEGIIPAEFQLINCGYMKIKPQKSQKTGGFWWISYTRFLNLNWQLIFWELFFGSQTKTSSMRSSMGCWGPSKVLVA